MKRFWVRGSGVLGAGSWFLILWFACVVVAAQNPQALLNRAVDEFEQGRFARLPRSTAREGDTDDAHNCGSAHRPLLPGRYADCRRHFAITQAVIPTT